MAYARALKSFQSLEDISLLRWCGICAQISQEAAVNRTEMRIVKDIEMLGFKKGRMIVVKCLLSTRHCSDRILNIREHIKQRTFYSMSFSFYVRLKEAASTPKYLHDLLLISDEYHSISGMYIYDLEMKTFVSLKKMKSMRNSLH